jgi:hypothetical protein
VDSAKFSNGTSRWPKMVQNILHVLFYPTKQYATMPIPFQQNLVVH